MLNTDSDEAALEMVAGAMDVGARGVMIGRNVWQHEDATAAAAAEHL
jgi:DhnA family fructose-bisphosphate aldolase class Ia